MPPPPLPTTPQTATPIDGNIYHIPDATIQQLELSTQTLRNLLNARKELFPPLTPPIPIPQTPPSLDDSEKPWWRLGIETDMRLLRTLLGQVLLEQRGEAFWQWVELLRQLGRAEANDLLSPTSLATLLNHYTQHLDQRARIQWVYDTTAAFRLFLTLISVVESTWRHHLFRLYPDRTLPRTIQELAQKGIARSTIRRHLEQVSIRLVATAHPTKILRRALLRHQRQLARLLNDLHHQATLPDASLTPIVNEMMESIEVLWATQFSRWQPPTVQDEVRHVLGYFETSLFEVLPALQQSLEELLEETPRSPFSPPSTIPPLKPIVTMGSWVGGDMDGNPYVTPPVTEEAFTLQYHTALRRLEQGLRNLAPFVTHASQDAPPDQEFIERLEAKLFALEQDDQLELMIRYRAWANREPYRVFLLMMADQLQNSELPLGTLEEERKRRRALYHHPQDVIDDLDCLERQLRQNGFQRSAQSTIRTLRNTLQIFGFHLATLDLREDSDVLRETARRLQPIFAGIGQPIPKDTPTAYTQWLTEQILKPETLHPEQVRHLLDADVLADLPERKRNAVMRLMGVIGTAHKAIRLLGHDACQHFIISMTETVTDLLEALWLLKIQGLFYAKDFNPLTGIQYHSDLKIAPLFETIDDLKNAPDVMRAAFLNPAYRRQLACHNNEQLIMIGYSDSNKDGGYVSSNWLLYRAQQEITAVAKQHGVRVRFFHGRGGNIGRGGAPTFRALQALPPGTADYGQDLTEQGEVLSRHYNLPDAALMHLETFLSGHITQALDGKQPAIIPTPWHETMDALSDHARTAYKKLFHQHPGLIEFFEHATPKEVELVRLGSRPAHRRAIQSIKDLRAIPWVFRWYQSRQLIPGWYGLGSAIEAYLADTTLPGTHDEKLAALKGLYKDWTFFQSLLENAAISLRLVDLNIAQEYAGLCDKPLLGGEIHHLIRVEYDKTRHWVLELTGQTQLLSRPEDTFFDTLIHLKTPYLAPLNHFQVLVIQTYRQLVEGAVTTPNTLLDACPLEECQELYHRAIISTIEGVASGLGTVG